MRRTIRMFLALLLSGAMLVGTVSCGGDEPAETTDSANEQTAVTTTATATGTVTTDAPNETTTTEPYATTAAPVTTTATPVTTTNAPVTTTATPVTTTATPVTTTNALVTTTKAPVTTTKAPVTTTKAPVTTTKAPVTTTKAPVTTTKAPVTTTKAAVTTTKAPVTTTKAPVTTTTAPVTEPIPVVCSHNYKVSATVDATCTAKGSKTYTCSKCGDSYSDEIAMLAHQYADATCTVSKTCSVCGATVGEALGHNFDKDNCTRCEETRTLHGRRAFLNYLKPDNNEFTPLNPDGSIDYNVIVANCGWWVMTEQYRDLNTDYSYIVPEEVFIEAIQKRFVFDESDIAGLKNASPYEWNCDFDSSYEDGYFYFTESLVGGFTPDYNQTVVGYVNRPGELTTYVEYSKQIYHPENDELLIGSEHLFYYKVVYEYEGDAEWIITGHYPELGYIYANAIASYDSVAVGSLRVKSVSTVDTLPENMTSAIQPTKVHTYYDYGIFDGENYTGVSFTIYESDPSVLVVNDTSGIDCCTEFSFDGEAVTCACGQYVFTTDDIDFWYVDYVYDYDIELLFYNNTYW